MGASPYAFHQVHGPASVVATFSNGLDNCTKETGKLQGN